MTMEAEYVRQCELFPNPERLEKVCTFLKVFCFFICWSRLHSVSKHPKYSARLIFIFFNSV